MGNVKAVGRVYEAALEVCRGSLSRSPRTLEAAAQLRGLIVELRDVGDGSAFLQGGCLARLEYDRLYQRLPEGKGLDWPTFVEDVLGIGIRRAQYLAAIYTKAVALGVTSETIEEIGWSKMRELLSVATRENVERWIKTARDETHAVLTSRVRAARQHRRDTGKDARRVPDPDAGTTTRWGLLLNTAQRRNIEDALRIAREEAKGRDACDDASLLDLIATDWRSNRLPRDRSLTWHLRQLSRVYQVRIGYEDDKRGRKRG